jgi:hypothetical protein
MSVRASGHQLTIQLPDEHSIVVTDRGLTDVSAQLSRRVGARAAMRGMGGAGADAGAGILYRREAIDAFTVEEDPWKRRRPCVVMTVREQVDASSGPRIERRRIYLHTDDSIEACLWLHAVLLRAVALGAEEAAGDARG